MIRLFVGIQIPAELRQRMAMLATPIDGARWVPEENLHITVRFIGDIPEDVAEDLAAALHGVKAPAFQVAIAGAGHFETRKRVRALWLDIERNEALQALHDRVDGTLVRSGLAPEGRRYKPHVTLARLKEARPATVRDWLAANGMFRAVPFLADKFVLFSSHLGRKGSIYTPEMEFPLIDD